MKTISIKLPPQLDSRLSALVMQEKTTRSRLIREIIERHMHEVRPVKDSALARAGDLVGSIKGTPRDLSTNPKHMKGFGR